MLLQLAMKAEGLTLQLRRPSCPPLVCPFPRRCFLPALRAGAAMRTPRPNPSALLRGAAPGSRAQQC